MKTKDLPQGVVGFKFAQALFSGEYGKAPEMLNAELKLEYPEAQLKKRYEEMISRAEEPAELADVEVLDNSELGHDSLDSEGWAYVAIWSEAVTVTVKPFGAEYLITELSWGRP
jgi:hypothetical protein